MIPDFGSIIWMVIAILEAIIAAGGFLLYVFWFQPAIARKFTRMKWSKGSPALIQHAGKVYVLDSKNELPEGVKYNKMGWFLVSMTPFQSDQEAKRGPGRPPKTGNVVPEGVTEEGLQKAQEIALRTPILDGLGRQVFFGSSDTALLSNLETIAGVTEQQNENKLCPIPKGTGIRHSVLSSLRALIPATMGRTQLDALAQFNYLRGLKVRGQEMMKVIIVAIAVIGVVATVGLVFYFLTQGGA